MNPATNLSFCLIFDPIAIKAQMPKRNSIIWTGKMEWLYFSKTEKNCSVVNGVFMAFGFIVYPSRGFTGGYLIYIPWGPLVFKNNPPVGIRPTKADKSKTRANSKTLTSHFACDTISARYKRAGVWHASQAHTRRVQITR